MPAELDTTMIRLFQVRNPQGETAPLYLLPDLYVDISASQIPPGNQRGASAPDELLAPPVADYIRHHGLYREAFTCEPPTQQLR